MRLLFVFVGIILIINLYLICATVAISFHHSSQSIPPILLWLLAILLIFFLSSLLTGLLVAPYIKHNFTEYLLSSPGLYLFVFGSLIAIANVILNEQLSSLTMNFIAWIAFGTVYALISCAGVALGCKLRSKMNREEHS